MAKVNRKKKDFFWLSYSDLMTSLFFVMLVLFVLVYSMQNKVINDLQAAKEELEKIKEITAATKALENGGLYEYNEQCKRFELKQEILFKVNSARIPLKDRPVLINAGKQIQELANTFKDNEKVKFMIIIEGRAAKYLDDERKNSRVAGIVKDLSYSRSLSLYKLWQQNGVDLNSRNSEIFIAGSGFEGMCRYEDEEEYKNKRFIVEVIPYLIE
jgi:hypothetical protein